MSADGELRGALRRHQPKQDPGMSQAPCVRRSGVGIRITTTTATHTRCAYGVGVARQAARSARSNL